MTSTPLGVPAHAGGVAVDLEQDHGLDLGKAIAGRYRLTAWMQRSSRISIADGLSARGEHAPARPPGRRCSSASNSPITMARAGGMANELQAQARDDPERAFGTHDQLGQLQAG